MGHSFDASQRVRSIRFGGYRSTAIKRLLSCFAALAIVLSASSMAIAASPAEDEVASVEELRSMEVAQYREDFDVSASIAERNLAVQSDAAGIVTALATVQGKDFAGVWFDNQAGEFIVGLAPAADPAPVLNVLDGLGVTKQSSIEAVQVTWDELERAQGVLNEKLKSLMDKGLIRTSLDPRANAVVVLIASETTQAQRQEVENAATDIRGQVVLRATSADRVVFGNTSCQFEFKRCTAPLRGGVGIKKGGVGWGPECTAAFKAVGKQFGSRFMLTAGHCVVLGEIYKWYAELPNNEEPAIGLVQGTVYPGGDWTAINANGSDWDQPSWPSQVAFWGQGTAAQETPITAESAAYLGQYVCHTGLSTGGHCGPVVDQNVSGPSQGGMQHHLTMFGPTCIEPGDSGGPVFAGNVALGITSARVEPPDPCGQEYGLFTEITEATDSLAVTVGPRLGTGPYGESEPTSEVTGTQATFLGVVNLSRTRFDGDRFSWIQSSS